MNLNFTLSFFLVLLMNFGYAQNYPMSASLTDITDCGGFFLDSGGGSSSYGPNQNFTTTICPDGTSGTHIQLVFGGTDLGDGDELCFYDGTSTAAPPLSCSADFAGATAFIIQATAVNTSGCLTVTFTSDGSGEGAGWSADINCIAACQTIIANLDNSDPLVEPVDTGYIDICPGDRVFFWGTGEYPQDGAVYNHSDFTSDFMWEFGEGATAFGPSVSHVFDEPGGYIVQLTITDQFGCKNTNFISQRVRVAPRPNFAAGDWPDEVCVADTVNLNAMIDSMDMGYSISVTPGQEGFQTAGILADSLPLPDGTGSSYTSSISFGDFSPGQVLTDINDLIGIWVNMEHSWMRDLEIGIECPNGQSVILHDHPGNFGGEVHLGIPYEADEGLPVPIPGIGYDYGWQVNPDFNNTWIEYANNTFVGVLPSGSYQSFEPLTNLLGCPLNGEWQITVTDLWAIDNGYIFSWSIEFAEELYPDIETFTPAIDSWGWNAHPSLVFNSADSIVGAPLNAGEVAYNFEVIDEFGCAWDTTAEIRILPQTHPDCRNCEELLTPAIDTSICDGEQLEFDVFMPIVEETSVSFESYEDYEIGAGNHPPANPYEAAIEINSINPMNIGNPVDDIVSVCLDLETDFDADIQLYLRSPSGALLELSTNNGGGGDNYTQTCFTPTATVPIQTGAAPFTGNFLPEGNWNLLSGSPINGTWTLEVSDAFGINTFGNLNWWSITFNSTNSVDFAWDNGGTLSCTNCPNPTATPTSDETYIVSATDDYGCVALDTINVAVLSNFAAPTISCEPQTGGQILFDWNDVAPGQNYEVNINGNGWEPASGSLSHLVTGLMNGDMVDIEVRVDLTNASCQVEIGSSFCSFVFCPIEAFTSQPGPFSSSCFNECDGEVEITVNNGSGTYLFDVTNNTTGTNFTQANPVLSNLCPGEYEVIVSDNLNCFDTVLFEIINPDALTVNAFQDNPVSCFGGTDGCASASASGGVGTYIFEWDDMNSSTGSPICNLPAGTYTVTATDINGCTGVASVVIDQPDEILLMTSSTPVSCIGDSDGTATVVPSGGTPDFTYQWSGGDTPNAATTSGLEAGMYTVTVEDMNGCQVFGSVDVGAPMNALTVEAVQTFQGCNGENNSVAEAIPMGGTAPYSYVWTPTGQTGQSIDMLPQGPYIVEVTDDAGCTAVDTVVVLALDPITVNLAGVPPTCHNGLDGSMAANIVMGGAGGYTFEWNTGDTDDFINGVQGGLVYSVTVTDMNGCMEDTSLILGNPPEMSLEIEITDALCNGEANGIADILSVANNQGDVTYQWDIAAGSQTTATATGLAAGTYNVVVTDMSDCVYSELVEIGEPEIIETIFETIDNECFGESNGSLEVIVSGGIPNFTYDWSNGQNEAQLSDLSADVYYLTVTDMNGCEKLDSIEIMQPDSVSWSFEKKHVSCFRGSDGALTINLTGGTPPYLYSLDNVDFFGSSTLIALESDIYDVFVQDNNGCIYQNETGIFQPPPLSVEILSDNESVDELTIPEGTIVQLDGLVDNGTGNIFYEWIASYCGTMSCQDSLDCAIDMNCQMPLAFPDQTNDYFLTVTDENGCTAEDHVQIHVTKQRVIEVPTGFTPNGDGINNRLVVHGKSGTMIDLFQVFDRWGELMYEDFEVPINESAVTGRGWDGTFKGGDMPSGVYVWYVEVTYADGMTESFKGETTLVR